MSKKVLSLVLALVMVLGSFSFVSAAKYDDVTGTTYAEAVDRLSLLGILEGYPDGTFKPDGEITRAEFAAVAIRAKGLGATAEAAQGLPTGFTDVPGTFWASGIIGTAGKLGIVNGVGNGQFAPQAPVKYEEAITMLVRALGYEPSAQAKGGYPYGYLIVANEVGLLDAVKGTQGAPATRGSVAQMTDNALEIEMMVQVGYGTDTKWVVSGTEDTDEKYLLDELGFDSVIGRVTSVNSNRKGITVTVEDEDEIKRLGKDKVSVSLPEGFDVYGIEGLETKIWYKDAIVIAKVLEEAKYDAFEYNEDDGELDLITEDESYEIAASKDLYDITIDDDNFKDLEDGDPADYAKVVLNDDDEVIWAQGYTFDGFVVVDEVKEDVVYSADDYDEVDVEDFLIVKDGKEIAIADLEEGDVLYYNDDEEFAVVYNNSKTGEIERVYVNNDQVRFGGKNYDLADDAIYLNEEGKIGELTADALEDIQDEEEEVTMFFNHKNEVTVVLAGPEAGTSAYYALRENANVYPGRKGKMVALDLRDSTGAKVSFDLDEKFVETDKNFFVQNDDGKFEVYNKIEELGIDGDEELLKGQVVKVTLDKDGDPKEVVKMTAFEVKNAEDIEIDDSKVIATTGDSYRLQSSTVVFYDELKEAIRLGNAKDEFSEVKGKDATFFVEKGNVVAIVGKTDADSDTTIVSGLLESRNNIRELKTDQWEIKIRVFGSNKTYVTEDEFTSNPFDADKYPAGSVIDLEIGDKTGEIKDFDLAKIVENVEIKGVRGKSIETKDKDYTFTNNAKAYEVKDGKYKEVRLTAIEGKTANLYMEEDSARYVNYAIIGAEAGTPDTKEGTVTYISTDGKKIEVDGKVYVINDDTVLRNEVGVIEYDGITEIKGALEENETKVFDIEVKDTNVITSFKYVAAKADKDAAAAVIKLINELPAATDAEFETKVTAARSAYNGLADEVKKNLVTNLAKLEAAEAKLQEEEDNAQAKEDAKSFTTTHSAILAKTVDKVAVADETAVDNALDAYDDLSNAAKALLKEEKALLDKLEERIDAIKAVNAAADEAKMKEALEDPALGLNLNKWNSLLGAQKDIVAKALLGGGFTDTASVQAALDAAI